MLQTALIIINAKSSDCFMQIKHTKYYSYFVLFVSLILLFFGISLVHIFSPIILSPNLRFFFWGEFVREIELLANFVWALTWNTKLLNNRHLWKQISPSSSALISLSIVKLCFGVSLYPWGVWIFSRIQDQKAIWYRDTPLLWWFQRSFLDLRGGCRSCVTRSTLRSSIGYPSSLLGCECRL